MNKQVIEQLVQTFVSSPGYLEEAGWLRSMETQQVVDKDGRPAPWLTYPGLDFLASRVRSSFTVFEYGSGNSTLWWSERVRHVVSCEHDKEWYAHFRKVLSPHIRYMYRRCKGGSRDYMNEITRYTSEFDILVIDGRQRVQCALHGVPALRPEGVILWDNTDRKEYQPGFDFLVTQGFRKIDFWGMGALSTRRWCTSFFYRRGNCLGL